MRDAWNRAMLDGAFERAWAISDAVLRQRAGRSCAGLPYHQRWLWDGTPLAGRQVLIRCWHGLGDTIQFIRLASPVARRTRAVTVEAQPQLLPLLRGIAGIAALFPLGAAPAGAEVAIESMELPHALRLSLAELPGPIPYLHAPPPRYRRSRRPRVGIVWAAGDWRPARSIPAALLRPLAHLPIDFVGLQQGPHRGEPDARGLVGEMLAADASVTETAAVIAGLDLVVAVDTMVAHLAGALGRPVWTLLDADADWRWMRHRRDSPWYPTMRLFRQPRPGAWEPVVAEMATALPAALRARRRNGNCAAPVGIGIPC